MEELFTTLFQMTSLIAGLIFLILGLLLVDVFFETAGNRTLMFAVLTVVTVVQLPAVVTFFSVTQFPQVIAMIIATVVWHVLKSGRES